MKILLMGKNGQVGWELAHILASLGELMATGREDVDLSDTEKLRETIRSIRPDIILNAAAYTAVDKAEHEPDVAMAINAKAPEIMAEEAKKLNCMLIHYSTDYVFDGAKHSPYVESDPPNPLNVYGRSKLAGEQAITASGVSHLIFRTSWVYSTRGSNFLLTVKRLVRENNELRIVDDQIGAPTSAREIARATVTAMELYLKQKQQRRAEISGLYHLTAAGETSWYGFAAEILSTGERTFNKSPASLLAVASSQYSTAARRPANSVLSNEKFQHTFGFALPSWKTSLNGTLRELQ